MASIVSVNRSTQKGTIKLPVLELYLLADEGAEGDAHAGHWHRQLSLLAEESIESMRDLGVEGLTPGIFAENITTKGLCLHTLPVGTRLQLGACVVEITQIGKECHKGCEIFKRVGRCVMPTEGVFARVLIGGFVRAGDPIRIIQQEESK